jgi:putative Ca2+/H+ antiporter (TMEM165/GDT1 family)
MEELFNSRLVQHIRAGNRVEKWTQSALQSRIFSVIGELCLEVFLISTGIVALAEIGDKTQLLAFILAARFKKPLPIILGILAATLANHTMAGAVGTSLTTVTGPQTLRWVLGVSFIAMAAWTLIPDQFDEKDAKLTDFGVFGTTLLESTDFFG